MFRRRLLLSCCLLLASYSVFVLTAMQTVSHWKPHARTCIAQLNLGDACVRRFTKTLASAYAWKLVLSMLVQATRIQGPIVMKTISAQIDSASMTWAHLLHGIAMAILQAAGLCFQTGINQKTVPASHHRMFVSGDHGKNPHHACHASLYLVIF